MYAASQVTKFRDRIHSTTVRLIDQFQGPLQVGLPRAADSAAEMLPSQPQFHNNGHHLSLGAIMQILFDASQPRRCIVDGMCPGSFKVPHSPGVLLGLQLLGLKRTVPAWHQVGERTDRSGCREEEHAPELPQSAKDRSEERQPDGNQITNDRHALQVAPPERPGDASADLWYWLGRWLLGSVCWLTLSLKSLGCFTHSGSPVLVAPPLRLDDLPTSHLDA
jgi:hypothetical protein